MTILQLKYIVTIAGSVSIREAATKLFISQPALSSAVKELEEELGFKIFERSSRGITLSPEGAEFLASAKQTVSQYELLEERYISESGRRTIFSVSAQHYIFPVNAFFRTIRGVEDNCYTFTINEVKTIEVLKNVRDGKSEIGVLSYSESNEAIIKKICKDYKLTFTPMFQRAPSVYVWKDHPLADRETISLDELTDYPCVFFNQDSDNEYYLNEEALSNFKYNKVIKVNDRAAASEIMAAMHAYSIGLELIATSAAISSNIKRIKTLETEIVTIGYITRKHQKLSSMGERYIENLARYRD